MAIPCEAEGPLTLKLRFLMSWMRARSRLDEVIDPLEAGHIANTIEALLPAVTALEAKPIPPQFRVFPGGKP